MMRRQVYCECSKLCMQEEPVDYVEKLCESMQVGIGLWSSCMGTL